VLFDPYARELSHDPSAAAPVKGIVIAELATIADKPVRAFADSIIYEVHVRGFTKAADIPCAGTYAGAAAKADYLASLGVTAIELLPIQEASNDRNDADPTSASGDNYWGYSTLAYFAPDRRYACDQSPGGPTRELRDMVQAFHARGIEVYVDVVYNHTAEGGGGVLSLRGLDNAGYYQLDRAGTGFTNSNGVGADLATFDKPLARNLMFDSLRYWRDTLGVDGFRFDLAPVLGNACGPGCFRFDPKLHEQLAIEFSDVDLIAEPWGVVAGSYQLGNHPNGWSEWNDKFRDAIRQDQNKTPVTPGWLANRVTGSSELYRSDGRMPSASVNYIVSHDGFTLHDLYACNAPNNAQGWPYGPSDGGSSSNLSWDHNADAAAQRQAVRTGLALLMVSSGVPMITGGDELGRSLRCNNNPYNVDSPATWLDHSKQDTALWTFASRLMHFRQAHRALHPPAWIEPTQVSWRDAGGNVLAGAAMDDASRPVLAWRLDGVSLGDDTIYIAYNHSAQLQRITLPSPPSGLAWYRVADTAAWMEAEANFSAPGSEHRMQQSNYDLAARSLAIFVAR
jgi:glycogen operon protein